jgi:hypothetical protein
MIRNEILNRDGTSRPLDQYFQFCDRPSKNISGLFWKVSWESLLQRGEACTGVIEVWGETWWLA